MGKLEIIYFEGLPRSGKTILTEQLCADYPGSFTRVGEYVHPDLQNGDDEDQDIFMQNDELKYHLASESQKPSLVDRGHLSTIIYSHAERLIRIDVDVTPVDDWYFNTIIKNNMLPSLYILLDNTAEASINRRTAPLNPHNMWDNIDALDFARTSYPRYMALYEPSVPVLILNSHSMPINRMKESVASYLGLTSGSAYL